MKKAVMLLFGIACSLLTLAQKPTIGDLESDKAAVKDLIERFLVRVGNNELDSLPDMFNEKANISGASFRNGAWTTYTMTFTEFLEMLRSRTNPTKYKEPVSKFTIHVDGGMLAFVKADAVLIRNEKPQSNNFDYFTLIKEHDKWKIFNGSYVSIPIEN